jgi:hypothetical protein
MDANNKKSAISESNKSVINKLHKNWLETYTVASYSKQGGT